MVFPHLKVKEKDAIVSFLAILISSFGIKQPLVLCEYRLTDSKWGGGCLFVLVKLLSAWRITQLAFQVTFSFGTKRYT